MRWFSLSRICNVCKSAVTVINDNRLSPHRRYDNFDWCEGAHRPEPESGVLVTEEHHRLRHQSLYRALRELIEDFNGNSTKPFAKVTLAEFTSWAKEQQDMPTHTDLNAHSQA